jgi:hypothetical protein
MSWNNDDMQDLIANAQRAEMLRQQDRQLEELKKQNNRQAISRTEPQEKTFKCPACAEWIKAEAKICKHCRTEVGEHFAAKIAAEEAQANEEQARIQRKRDEVSAQRLKEERAEQQRIDEINRVYQEERKSKLENRRQKIEKLQNVGKSGTGKTILGALILVLLILLTTNIFAGLEQAEKLEQKKQQNEALIEEERKKSAALFEEKRKEASGDSKFIPEACSQFSNTLGALTLPTFSKSKLQTTSDNLSRTLRTWKKESGVNSLIRSLEQFIGAIKSISSSGGKKITRELSNLGMPGLIKSCNLNNQFSYPSKLTFKSGCWPVSNYPTKIELQERKPGGSWRTVAEGVAGETSLCDSGVTYGADISFERGIMRSDLNNYGIYRVKISNADGRVLADSYTQKYTCESNSKKADDEIFSEGYCIEE